jgi:hypothetical protein
MTLLSPEVITHPSTPVVSDVLDARARHLLTYDGTDQYATLTPWKSDTAESTIRVSFTVDVAASGADQYVLTGVSDASVSPVRLQISNAGRVVTIYRDVANNFQQAVGPILTDGEIVSLLLHFSPVTGVTITLGGVDYNNPIVASPITWQYIGANAGVEFFGGSIWNNRYTAEHPMQGIVSMQGDGVGRYAEYTPHALDADSTITTWLFAPCASRELVDA